MKVKELRIGNYISGIYINGDCSEYDSYEENEELCKVVGIDSVGFSEYNIWVDGLEKSGIENYDSFEPIPITEEWLLKFGYKKLDDSQFYKKKTSEKYYLLTSHHQGYTEICVNSICGGQAVTKYVHQLQNLYFALTGEELVLSSEAQRNEYKKSGGSE